MAQKKKFNRIESIKSLVYILEEVRNQTLSVSEAAVEIVLMADELKFPKKAIKEYDEGENSISSGNGCSY